MPKKGESKKTPVDANTVMQRAKQKDLDGRDAARGMRVRVTTRQTALVKSPHFQVSVPAKFLEDLEKKEEMPDKEKAIQKRVVPQPDIREIPVGAADEEIPQLIAAVIHEISLKPVDEYVYVIGDETVGKPPSGDAWASAVTGEA